MLNAKRDIYSLAGITGVAGRDKMGKRARGVSPLFEFEKVIKFASDKILHLQLEHMRTWCFCCGGPGKVRVSGF